MHPGGQDPDRLALVMGESGETRTYGELDANANRVSRLLREHGLEVGGHVALIVENSPVFFDIVWGSRYAGLFYTACSTGLTGEELAYIVDDCGATTVFLSARYADRAEALRNRAPNVEHWLSVGGAIEGFEAYEDAVAHHEPTPLDETRIAGRDMLYSSGTTGKPKGIRPTTEFVPLEETPIIVTEILAGMFGVGPDDVYLSPAPLYHAAPLRFCMSFHQLGSTVVVMESS